MDPHDPREKPYFKSNFKGYMANHLTHTQGSEQPPPGKLILSDVFFVITVQEGPFSMTVTT